MKIRNSNLEALRIIAILMVLYIHAFGLISGMGYTDFGREMTVLANCICNIGVSCFILISGYFGIHFEGRQGWEKVIRMELMVIFYSLIMTLLSALFFPDMLTDSVLELFVKSCIPVASRKYWFYSCYICLVLLSPFLNRAIERVERRVFQNFLMAMLLLFCILPTFLYFEITLDHGKGLINMITLYVLGRWIRLYADVEIDRKKAVLAFLLLTGLNYLSHRFPVRLGGISHTLTVDNSITNIMMAVILFYLFKGLKFQSAKINYMARNIFAVFIMNTFVMQMVHDYLIRFDMEKIHSNWMPLWITADVVLTFLICVLIEFIRKGLFGGLEKILVRFIVWGGQRCAEHIHRINWKKWIAFICK